MRALSQGYSRQQTFTSLMNIPKPMTANNYDKIVQKIKTVVKEVAKDTMKGASNELHEAASTDNNTAIDTAVSCDCSWQQRGFSSLKMVL